MFIAVPLVSLLMLAGVVRSYHMLAPKRWRFAVAGFSTRMPNSATERPGKRIGGSSVEQASKPRVKAASQGAGKRLKPSAKEGEPETPKVKDRPFTLPPGEHKPKQSLGQNYLSDQNYVVKICDAFQDDSEEGRRVVEIGPGMGALTRVLVRKYPKMTAIEVDKRSVRFLNENLPGLDVVNEDVLKFDWEKLSEERGGKLNVIANLPYYITSQVLFSLADVHHVINTAVVTMQWEVGERVTALPGNKDYGIPSVVFQLYGRTHLNFKIPPKVFFPVPKVDSALVTIDFTKPHKSLHLVEPEHLRK
jgi:16S rRNA (adenine1518-N6/adenine1519-N6)-dimethyltransferase